MKVMHLNYSDLTASFYIQPAIVYWICNLTIKTTFICVKCLMQYNNGEILGGSPPWELLEWLLLPPPTQFLFHCMWFAFVSLIYNTLIKVKLLWHAKLLISFSGNNHWKSKREALTSPKRPVATTATIWHTSFVEELQQDTNIATSKH